MHAGATLFDWDELQGLGVDADGEILDVRVRNNLPTGTNGSVFCIVPSKQCTCIQQEDARGAQHAVGSDTHLPDDPSFRRRAECCAIPIGACPLLPQLDSPTDVVGDSLRDHRGDSRQLRSGAGRARRDRVRSAAAGPAPRAGARCPLVLRHTGRQAWARPGPTRTSATSLDGGCRETRALQVRAARPRARRVHCSKIEAPREKLLVDCGFASRNHAWKLHVCPT